MVVEWQLSRVGGTAAGKVTFQANLNADDPGILSFGLPLPHVTKLEACLFACVAKSLVGPLIECIGQHKADINKVKDCLRAKGLGLTASAAACAVDCALKHW